MDKLDKSQDSRNSFMEERKNKNLCINFTKKKRPPSMNLRPQFWIFTLLTANMWGQIEAYCPEERKEVDYI